mmetsp:Transcript_701/g.2786  ORF Transcript_701/g.2786 Transcript_701/m.2786 type:complete len:109 (+) Transcript_701:1002-1328(+)
MGRLHFFSFRGLLRFREPAQLQTRVLHREHQALGRSSSHKRGGHGRRDYCNDNDERRDDDGRGLVGFGRLVAFSKGWVEILLHLGGAAAAAAAEGVVAYQKERRDKTL